MINQEIEKNIKGGSKLNYSFIHSLFKRMYAQEALEQILKKSFVYNKETKRYEAEMTRHIFASSGNTPDTDTCIFLTDRLPKKGELPTGKLCIRRCDFEGERSFFEHDVQKGVLAGTGHFEKGFSVKMTKKGSQEFDVVFEGTFDWERNLSGKIMGTMKNGHPVGQWTKIDKRNKIQTNVTYNDKGDLVDATQNTWTKPNEKFKNSHEDGLILTVIGVCTASFLSFAAFPYLYNKMVAMEAEKEVQKALTPPPAEKIQSAKKPEIYKVDFQKTR